MPFTSFENLENARKWLGSVLQYVVNEVKGGRSRMLYHYTNAAALLSIDENRALWATDIRYVNDSAELVEAMRTFLTLLQESKEAYPELTPSMVDSLQNLIAERKFLPTYVVSFSQDGDSLGQWRGYCPNGKGYSLGFDSKNLYTDQPDEWILAPCIYKKEEHKKVIEITVKETLASKRGWDSSEAEIQQMLNTLMFRLEYIAPLIKNEAFASEQEWRLIYRAFKGGYPVKYRERNGALIPYVQFALSVDEVLRLPAIKLVVGPTHHKELGLEAANGFKESSRLGIQNVKSSEIPYQML